MTGFATTLPVYMNKAWVSRLLWLRTQSNELSWSCAQTLAEESLWVCLAGTITMQFSWTLGFSEASKPNPWRDIPVLWAGWVKDLPWVNCASSTEESFLSRWPRWHVENEWLLRVWNLRRTLIKQGHLPWLQRSDLCWRNHYPLELEQWLLKWHFPRHHEPSADRSRHLQRRKEWHHSVLRLWSLHVPQAGLCLGRNPSEQ